MRPAKKGRPGSCRGSPLGGFYNEELATRFTGYGHGGRKPHSDQEHPGCRLFRRLEGIQKPGRLYGAQDRAGQNEARAGAGCRKGLRVAWPGRRGFSVRSEMELHAQGHRQAFLSDLQRGRERARHLQGSPDHDARSPPVPGGHDHRLLYGGVQHRLHLHPRGIPESHCQYGKCHRRAVQGQAAGQEHHGQQVLPGYDCSSRQ